MALVFGVMSILAFLASAVVVGKKPLPREENYRMQRFLVGIGFLLLVFSVFLFVR